MVRQNICIICTHLSMNCLLPRAINTPYTMLFSPNPNKNMHILNKKMKKNLYFTRTHTHKRMTWPIAYMHRKKNKGLNMVLNIYGFLYFLFLSSTSFLMCFVVGCIWSVNDKNNRCLGLNYVISFKSLSLN